MDEKKFILDSFNTNFESVKREKLVIYGLGKNTRLILDECKDYGIVGLMDSVRTGEIVWGLPVITCEEAYRLGVSIIIIVATSANVPIIYQRIAEECEYYNIKVYDINGYEQKKAIGEYVLPNHYKTNTVTKLREKIDKSDIVSFDIFDTLLVRNTLQPTDVFENLRDKNVGFPIDFCEKRIKAERELYNIQNPNIYDIYGLLADWGTIKEDEIEYYVKLEIEEEKKCLHVRTSMLDAMNYALKRGKIVCCTSDMYLTEPILIDILKINGISAIDSVLVSCEYNKSKSNGLFHILKERYKDQRILHIGDNHNADIICAKRSGIDEVFEIASIYRMIADSKISNILSRANSLVDRNVLGTFASHMFNNPFLFKSTEGKLKIFDCYDLGYYFFEPIIEAFLTWMIKTIDSDHIQYLLLGSRDGWLIQNLLNIYKEYEELNVEYDYFYVSRAACTMAGMNSKDDVRYAASLTFDGTVEMMLSKRFLLEKSEILERKEYEDDEQYLLRHYDLILAKVQKCKDRYMKYAYQRVPRGKKIGFFDFVSSGSCQLWLEKMLGVQMKGYYFARNYDQYKEHLDIKSLFRPAFVYEKQSKLYKDYVVLENVITSPEPTLRGFDDNGRPVFADETRSKTQLNQLSEIHKGIIDAFSKKIREKQLGVSIGLAEEIMDLVRSEYSVIEFDFFKSNSLEDEFCNRSFDLQQVLESNIEEM